MEQTQIQTTSAMQVMLSELMEMPLASLEERVAGEMDCNEAIEVNDEMMDDALHDMMDRSSTLGDDTAIGDEMGVRNSHTTDDDYDEFVTIDQVPEDMRSRYNADLSRAAGRGQYDGDQERQIADQGATSYDDIMAQIGELSLTDEETMVMEYLVGSLDERGYLVKDNQTILDELIFRESIYMEEADLERIIGMLQSFEPRGIGARNLQDCMLLQMETDSTEPGQRQPLVKRLAYRVVRDMWDEVIHSRWKKIQDELDVTTETIAEIQHTLQRLNPKPGSGLNESTQAAAPTVIADFSVETDDDGHLYITQNRGNIPELRVSSSYAETVNEFHDAQERARKEGRKLNFSRQQKEGYEYASHKVESARAFIECLKRRRHTLQLVVENIVKWQKDFFLGDDDETLLRPMVLHDIAERAGVDQSTVSRAANSKYIQTKTGTYPLKFFFGTEFVNADGDNVSQRQVQLAIREIIENEDPRHPYSDQKITDILQSRGTTVARRTVAKYREGMGFPTSSLRRR